MTARLSDLAHLPDWPRQLSRAQAAAYIGVSPGTLDQDIRAGRYPRGVKVGGRILWDRKALDVAVDRIHGTGAKSTDEILERLNDRQGPGRQTG